MKKKYKDGYVDKRADGTIVVDHPNGFTGILYGHSSMIINKDGKEVLHTGFRKCNTAETLYEHLAEMPEFIVMINKAFEDAFSENNSESEEDFI